jgi:hypothetical protein
MDLGLSTSIKFFRTSKKQSAAHSQVGPFAPTLSIR